VIRAFDQEHTIVDKQKSKIDDQTRHFIAHHSCWCWYNLRFFYISCLFYVTTLILIAKNRTAADTVVLVLCFNWTQDMGWLMHFFGCMNWFKRNVSEAQRVFNLHHAPQERLKGEDGSPADWPTKGALEFKDVFLRYRPNCDRALNGVSFRAEAGEKIGVVGRTGAGKSTLFMGLTRIVEIESGTIEIDGQDIDKLDLKALRNQITMIPQDPTLFTGSLRFNLDPFDQHSDERLMELIKKAGLEYLMEGSSKQELEDKAAAAEKADSAKVEDEAVSAEDSAATKSETEKSDASKAAAGNEKMDNEDDGKGLKFKV